MSTIELFITTIACCTLGGIGIGYGIAWILDVIPAHRHIAYYRGRAIRYQAKAELVLRQHKGTPYRPDTVAAARLLSDVFAPDDHIASRRAPDAPVVSLPRPRVTA